LIFNGDIQAINETERWMDLEDVIGVMDDDICCCFVVGWWLRKLLILAPGLPGLFSAGARMYSQMKVVKAD
jgi:hypothetical protein